MGIYDIIDEAEWNDSSALNLIVDWVAGNKDEVYTGLRDHLLNVYLAEKKDAV